MQEGEDGENGCLRAGCGNAPWGARRGSVFLVPICSSPFFVAFVLWSFVTVYSYGLRCELSPGLSQLKSGGGLPSVGGERECFHTTEN